MTKQDFVTEPCQLVMKLFNCALTQILVSKGVGIDDLHYRCSTVQRHILATSKQAMVACGRRDEKDEGMR